MQGLQHGDDVFALVVSRQNAADQRVGRSCGRALLQQEGGRRRWWRSGHRRLLVIHGVDPLAGSRSSSIWSFITVKLAIGEALLDVGGQAGQVALLGNNEMTVPSASNWRSSCGCCVVLTLPSL
jgi:hypothetical protein